MPDLNLRRRHQERQIAAVLRRWEIAYRSAERARISGATRLAFLQSARVPTRFLRGGCPYEMPTTLPWPSVMYSGAGNDHIEGRGGHDCLHGEEGDDELLGGDGNDYLPGGAGANRIDGQAGEDFVTYWGPNAVRVDLAAATARHADGEDVLVSVESVAGSEGADCCSAVTALTSSAGWAATTGSTVAAATTPSSATRASITSLAARVRIGAQARSSISARCPPRSRRSHCHS